jgi:signal peptidase II
MRNDDRRKYVSFTILALVGAAFDQLSKVWARGHLRPFGYGGMPVIGRKIVFVYAENPGVAFSQFQTLNGGRVVLSAVSFIALVVVILYLRKTDPARRGMTAGLGLICGGALGNMLDRLRLGYVTDFIRVNLGVWPFNPWPVFNVADAVLVAGAALMILTLRRGGNQNR